MRRIAFTTGLLGLTALLLALILGTSAQGSSTGTFDVIFDDARGLIGGQLVKIAGAKAGTIENVTVTKGFKARIQASIDSKFLPFHQDATCTIRPEGLIAENYIDCNPGTVGSPPLRGNPPTVGVSHTTEPVSLLDLFNIFNLPTRERFQVIIDELGIGTAGRGADFNDILRRANPALGLARQAIGILTRQKAQLATIVDASSRIAAEGAGHTANVQNFITRAAALSTLTAAHHDTLSQTIGRLPGLLAAAQPALQQTDIVARDGTPLLSQLHAAVPSLNRVATDLGPFVTAAKPGLAKLGSAITTAIPAIRKTTPLISTLRSYLSASLPSTQLFAKLASNLQQRGFVENFLSVAYYVGTSLARYDPISHLLSVLLVGPGGGLCGIYATSPTAGCSAHYAPQAATAADTVPSRPARRSRAVRAQSSGAAAGSGAATAGGQSGSGGSGGPSGTSTGSAAGGAATGSGGAATGATGTAGATGLPGAAGSAVSRAGQALQNLLGYLTK